MNGCLEQVLSLLNGDTMHQIFFGTLLRPDPHPLLFTVNVSRLRRPRASSRLCLVSRRAVSRWLIAV